jgi:hypothetical protein
VSESPYDQTWFLFLMAISIIVGAVLLVATRV